jgi:hypothetical protein
MWIADLDGTLALRTERNWYDWHRVGEDLPNRPVVAAVSALIHTGQDFCYVTGRPEECRMQTLIWLRHNVDSFVTSDRLFMRPGKADARSDVDIKAEIYKKHFAGVTIDGVFDDRDSVVRMWRDKYDLTVFQVAYGDF